jgi:preprotein translocase subunit SecD
LKADRIRLFFVVVVLIVALVAIFWPNQSAAFLDSSINTFFKNIRLGLDIRGGTRLDYKVVVSEETEKSIDEIANEVVIVVRQRLDAANYTEAVVSKISGGADSRIRVEIPGIDDPTIAERLVGKKGKLYFGEILEQATGEEMPAKRIGIKYMNAVWVPSKERNESKERVWYLVNPYSTVGSQKLYLDGSEIKNAKASVDTQKGGFKIDLEFTAKGTDLFGKITTAFVDKQLPIVLDDIVLVAPQVVSAIRSSTAEISGRFTAQEAMELAALIKSGNLPADLQKMEERTLGPTLGKDIITVSLIAGIFGLLIVMVYMVVFYGLSGLIADLSLIYNTLVILGAMALGKFILTLPGIGGIILTFGTAIDGNIIIIERIKEEIRSGKTILNAITAGYSKSFSAIFDANITSILAGVVLYYLGTGTIKGFATTLIIGILGSMFATLIVSRVLTDMFSSKLHFRMNKETVKAGDAQ